MIGFARKNKISKRTITSSRSSQKSRNSGLVDEWLPSQLKFRFRVLEPSQEEESENYGLSQKYTILKRVWGGVIPISHNSYRRWVSTEDFEKASHELIFRFDSFSNLYTEFSSAYSTDFDNISDLNPLKDSMFLFLEKSTTDLNKGKMFRIRRIMNPDENDEYLSVLAEEMEELGTGATFDSDYME